MNLFEQESELVTFSFWDLFTNSLQVEDGNALRRSCLTQGFHFQKSGACANDVIASHVARSVVRIPHQM